MKKVTLTNDFHSSEATLIPQLITEGRYKGYYRISKAVARRVFNELCGSDDCLCGDTFGARGGGMLDIINEDYCGGYIVEEAD